MMHSTISGSEWSTRFCALVLGACLLCPVGCVVESLDDESAELDDVDELEQGLSDEAKLCISKCRSDPDTGTGMCKAARQECLQIAKDQAERRQCRSDFRVCRETRRACIDACKGGGGAGGKQP
jgi:hypothetical protein